jgi:hypothetical protein
MRFTLLALVLLAIPLSGCQTLKDATAARGSGSSRMYDAPFDKVWRVIPKAANDLDLSIAGSYEDEKYILAERGTTMFSWGERVAIFVDSPTESSTSVEVVSKRAVAVNITATNFEKSLLDKIGERLSSSP